MHLLACACLRAVLGGSSLLEFYSLMVAAKAMAAGAAAQGYAMQGWKDWARYILRGRDPTTAAVLAEDVGAVAGLGIASEAALRLRQPVSQTAGPPVHSLHHARLERASLRPTTAQGRASAPLLLIPTCPLGMHPPTCGRRGEAR